ncbi:MAG: hypothetical protein IKD77_04835 [Bacilli bacterium]|nr:hypothetical protein [Bacilli bacterium]
MEKNTKKPEVVAQLTLTMYDNGDVEIDYPQDLCLNDRIILLTQALQHQTAIYRAMTTLDHNRNWRM